MKTLQHFFQIVLLLGAVLAQTACTDPTAPKFTAVDITGVDYARDFSVPDHNGQTRSMKDFAGKVVVIFFGYTQCPDVCPTSMSELAEVKRLLGPKGDRLQGLFVSLDPERDKPEMLKAYMAAFDPSFLALTPSAEALPALTKEFKIYYKKVAGQTPTSYTMDHSAGSYIFDTQGKVRLYARYNSGAKAMAADIAQLLN